jgi:hypothetical protein
MEEIESGMGVLAKPIVTNLANRQIPVRNAAASPALPSPSPSPRSSAEGKTQVMQMAESMIQAMKDEEVQKSLRGISVYTGSYTPDNIIGEVVISPVTTVQEMIEMIERELGVSPGSSIKKKNIPIAKTQWSHKAFEFFRSHEDYAVVFQ